MPEVIERSCASCGRQLDPVMASLGMMSHPACTVSDVGEVHEEQAVGQVTFDTPVSGVKGIPLPEEAENLKAELTTIVRWYEEFSPRAQQVSLGPSDLGHECDRALAYKVAGIRGNNMGDPWPASVGSAIHSRLEMMIRDYQAANGGAWQIERKIKVDPMITGRADLVRPPDLVDIKSAGKDMMDKVKRETPPRRYLVQINAYAKGLRDEGIDIQRVSLAFFPRSGWLSQLHVWTAPYDEALALEGIQRPYLLAQKLQELDILANPHRWEQIPATPGMGCNWCSLYNKHRKPEEGANDKMCPGWNK